jgi:SAC3 family protein LENG8/THP3
LKGQSSFPTPAVAVSTAQPSRKPNPSRFAPAPPIQSTSAPPPPPPAPSTSYSPYSTTPSPQPSVPAPVKPTNPPNNNSSPAPSPWPPTLKTYVEKSFAQCETDADRSFIEDKLKSLISKVTNDGRMHKHRWELEPIPIPPSQQPPTPVTSAFAADGPRDEVREPRRKKSRFQPIDDPPPQDISGSASSSGGQGNRIVPAKVTSKEEINRQNRANRFMREHNLQQQQQQPQSQKQSQKQHQGKKRKSQNVSTSHSHSQTPSFSAVSSSGSGSGGYSDADLESFVVIGTCSKVEKDYFRLTSAPDPSTVRPLEVLKKALELVKEKWSQFRRADADGTDTSTAGSGNGGTGTTTYIWLCSQLKSIRQDVMVQHIKNGTDHTSSSSP